jgi:hypothetical protein
MGKNSTQEQHFEAIKEGAKEAIVWAMQQRSDMPGEDTFEMIKAGVKEAASEWFDLNKKQIINAIKETKLS